MSRKSREGSRFGRRRKDPRSSFTGVSEHLWFGHKKEEVSPRAPKDAPSILGGRGGGGRRSREPEAPGWTVGAVGRRTTCHRGTTEEEVGFEGRSDDGRGAEGPLPPLLGLREDRGTPDGRTVGGAGLPGGPQAGWA